MTARAFANADEQREFVTQVQTMLRDGKPGEALSLARRHMKTVAEVDETLAELALDVTPDDLELLGWDDLPARLNDFDRRGIKITAVQVDFSNRCHSGREPDEDGLMAPDLETTYYVDSKYFDFTASDRAAMAAAYEDGGTPWQGNFEDIDYLFEVVGMEALYGAVQQRDERRDRDSAAGDSFVIAATICQVLVHLRIKDSIENGRLPRTLAFMVGSNEDFPFIDAPVITFPGSEALRNPEPDPAPEEEEALAAENDIEPEPEPDPAPSGTELRRQLIDPDAIELEDAQPDSWWRRLFARAA